MNWLNWEVDSKLSFRLRFHDRISLYILPSMCSKGQWVTQKDVDLKLCKISFRWHKDRNINLLTCGAYTYPGVNGNNLIMNQYFRNIRVKFVIPFYSCNNSSLDIFFQVVLKIGGLCSKLTEPVCAPDASGLYVFIHSLYLKIFIPLNLWHLTLKLPSAQFIWGQPLEKSQNQLEKKTPHKRLDC